MTGPRRPGIPRLVATPVLVGLLLAGLYLYYHGVNLRIYDIGVLNATFISQRLVDHVKIVAVAFGIATAIALPLGVLLAEAGPWARLPVLLVANLGQAVPSIGILAIGFTFFGIGLQGPAIALVVYALLPILRNTMVGIQGIDPGVLEAARGMGMTRLQALRRVRLPLASPVVFAGLRTSLVLVVGTATLANFTGGGGLGDLIATGNLSHPNPLLVGAVLVAALALILDWVLGLVELAVVPRTA